MQFLLILFAFSLFSPINGVLNDFTGGCGCYCPILRLESKGNPNITGFYKHQNGTHNERPTYLHQSRNLSIYYDDLGDGYWALGAFKNRSVIQV